MPRFSLLISCVSVFALSACNAHRINETPAPELQNAPQNYSMASAQGEGEQSTAQPWYQNFGDSNLNNLIETSLDQNLDARQAIARIAQARAVTAQSSALRLPAVDANASVGKDWQDSKAQDTVSRAGVAVSWEADLFNRLGGRENANRYSQKATIEDLAALRLSLSAELAQNYYSAIASHRLLALLNAQNHSDLKLLELVKSRQAAGIGTNVEVLQQQSQLAENQSLVPLEEAQLRLAENRLDVLLAHAPDGEDRTSLDDLYPVVQDLPSMGVPADLLLRRPDLRAMQNRLIAQDAEIGVAIAERLPKLSLGGSFTLVNGIAAQSPVTSLLGSFVQPLLDWGRRKAEVERNKALYEEKLAAFTQAYLLAIEEVENALYQENRQREYLKRLEARRDLLEQTLNAAQAVYNQGESDYISVLSAVEDLRDVERNVVREQLKLIHYRIALFKALGGGLDSQEEYL